VVNQGSVLEEEAEQQLLQRLPARHLAIRSIEQLLSGLILFDLFFIGIPMLMLVPLFKLAHLPLQFDVIGIATAFYGGTGVSGAFSAVMMLLIAFSPRQTVGPILARCRIKRATILFAPLTFAVLAPLLGIGMGIVVTFVCIGAAELL
jgi:hypothetical protein